MNNKIPSQKIQDFLDSVLKRGSNPTSYELLDLSLNATLEESGVILGLACHLGYLEVCQKVLQVYPDIINFKTDLKKYTDFSNKKKNIDLDLSPPLLISLMTNNVTSNQVSLFLINHPDLELNSLRKEIVENLLKLGANPLLRK